MVDANYCSQFQSKLYILRLICGGVQTDLSTSARMLVWHQDRADQTVSSEFISPRFH